MYVCIYSCHIYHVRVCKYLILSLNANHVNEQILVFSRDSISETKPTKTSMWTSLVEYGDILILIGKFPSNAKITGIL